MTESILTGRGVIRKHGDRLSRVGVDDGFGPNVAAGQVGGQNHGCGVPGPRDGGVIVVPVPTGDRRRGAGRAGRSIPGPLVTPGLRVGTIAVDIDVVAAGTGDVHQPASEHVVALGVLHLGGDGAAARGGDAGEQRRIRAGYANRGGAHAPGWTIAQGAKDVDEPEVITYPDLNSVHPDGHIVVRHTADLYRGGGAGGPGKRRGGIGRGEGRG